MQQAECDETLRQTVIPVVLPGDILIFDYRALHRGCANPTTGKARPVAVFTFAQVGCGDMINFPNGSIFDLRPGAQHQPSSGPRHQTHSRTASQPQLLLNWVGSRWRHFRTLL